MKNNHKYNEEVFIKSIDGIPITNTIPIPADRDDMKRFYGNNDRGLFPDEVADLFCYGDKITND